MFGMIGTSNSTPRTWKRMAPSSCNAVSAPVYETTFTLGQYSYVHPARLEWYIVGAWWLAGGSTVQSLNRQRTHGSIVRLTAVSFAYGPRAVTRWQSKKKKENSKKACKEKRLILRGWTITCSPTRMIYSQLADVRIWLHEILKKKCLCASCLPNSRWKREGRVNATHTLKRWARLSDSSKIK